MVIDGPTAAVAVCRAGVEPDSPAYQDTVLAGVPLTSDIAVSNGGPLTRSGGLALKKLLDAAMADAAGSAVCARLESAPVKAVCKLVAVAVALAPMVNWLAPGGELVVACSVTVWLVPSGSVRLNLIESPGLGLAPSATATDGGEPDGPVTVAPVRLDVTLANAKPNGEPSWLTVRFGPVAVAVSRPSPLAPRA